MLQWGMCLVCLAAPAFADEWADAMRDNRQRSHERAMIESQNDAEFRSAAVIAGGLVVLGVGLGIFGWGVARRRVH